MHRTNQRQHRGNSTAPRMELQALGFVTLPLALFDPGNDCNGKGLLSGSGAYLMGRWTIDEVLELYRGAFALHTRSYVCTCLRNSRRNVAVEYQQFLSYIASLAPPFFP